MMELIYIAGGLLLLAGLLHGAAGWLEDI